MRESRVMAPRVYAAITAITTELACIGIAKAQVNAEDGYRFRGIDDVLKALAPLLARHKLCILPRVLERTVTERQGTRDSLLVSVSLRAAFDFVSARDGSMHAIEAWGEALDEGDKATAKAMSAAYKQAMVQAFCIPVAGLEDGDARSLRLRPHPEQPDPVQGWEQWSADIRDMIRLCERAEALDRVQETYRTVLRSASKRRPDLYEAIGKAVGERRADLAGSAPANRRGAKANGKSAQVELAHG